VATDEAIPVKPVIVMKEPVATDEAIPFNVVIFQDE